MKGLSLPTEPGRLIVAADGDDPGRAAAAVLADRACRLGWEVHHLRPPTGWNDWNDILRERATA